MTKVAIHPSITATRVLEASKREMFGTDNPGFCIGCGHEQEGCEPDARRYECEICSRNLVFGAAEILLCGYYHNDKEEPA